MPSCRSCGAAIEWALTESGRPMPVDVERRPDGNIVLEHHAVGKPPVAHVLDAGELELHRRQHEANLARGLDDGGSLLFVSHFATCPDAAHHRRSR